jgi:hypothetical protein
MPTVGGASRLPAVCRPICEGSATAGPSLRRPFLGSAGKHGCVGVWLAEFVGPCWAWPSAFVGSYEACPRRSYVRVGLALGVSRSCGVMTLGVCRFAEDSREAGTYGAPACPLLCPFVLHPHGDGLYPRRDKSLSAPNNSACFPVESRPLANSRSRPTASRPRHIRGSQRAGSVSAGCPLEGGGGLCYLDGSRLRLSFCTRRVVSLLEGVFLGCC